MNNNDNFQDNLNKPDKSEVNNIEKGSSSETKTLPKQEKAPKIKKAVTPEMLIKHLRHRLTALTAWVVVLSLLVVALAGHLFREPLIYEYSQFNLDRGNVNAAVNALKLTPNYTGAADLLDKYAFSVVGNVVSFGTYEQDGNTVNGNEPLEWVVLDVQGDKALIVTRYCMDCKQYCADYKGVTWETSDIRTWLNNRFIEKTFTDTEAARIITTDVETPDNPTKGTNGGNTTTDRVFLLSSQEFEKYLAGTDYAIGYTTKYAQNKGVQSGPISGTSVCWLRTPGESFVYVSTVSYVGELNSMGIYSYSKSAGIRPAMWVSVN